MLIKELSEKVIGSNPILTAKNKKRFGIVKTISYLCISSLKSGGGRVERNSLGIQLKDGGAAPPLRSNCGRRVERNSPGYQLGDGEAASPFRSKHKICLRSSAG